MSHGPITRRTALRLAAGSGVLALAGCGNDASREGTRAREVARTSIAIDHASFYAPIDDLRALVRRRAAERGAAVLFSDDPSGAPAQAASLRRLTGADGGFGAVVVAPFDAGALAPIVRAARGRDIHVIGYVVPVPGQDASIAVDAEGAGRQLAEHAADWARRQGSRGAIVLTPPPTAVVPDPFLPYARTASTALVAALGKAGLDVAATVNALGRADATPAVAAARRAAPGTDVVLTWNDATALGAASALGDDAYVGGLCAPAVSGLAAFDALAGDGPLRCLVAPRLSELADALVDFPYALLGGAPGRTVTVPARRYTRRSAAAAAARGDYSG